MQVHTLGVWEAGRGSRRKNEGGIEKGGKGRWASEVGEGKSRLITMYNKFLWMHYHWTIVFGDIIVIDINIYF